MAHDNVTIQHVSDTALWVAHYRAMESERANPLFEDRFAKVLVGDRGRKIAESMKATARYTQWSVVIRTRVIDSYLQHLASEGVDTVINLGAGLDTRPYRLKLPASLRWIEIDYPDMIAHKEKLLGGENPGVQLERIALDLSDRAKRREVFAQLAARAQKAVILTEGVIPYLTEEQVATLAEDLRAEKSFSYWIAEYFSPAIYRYFRTPEHKRRMKNAPFRFFPADWFGFFALRGWKPRQVRYLAEEAKGLGRPMPFPWWARLLISLSGKKGAGVHLRQMGYVLFAPA